MNEQVTDLRRILERLRNSPDDVLRLADLEELRKAVDYYSYVCAAYGTAVIFHDLDHDCDCETCSEAGQIKAAYA